MNEQQGIFIPASGIQAQPVNGVVQPQPAPQPARQASDDIPIKRKKITPEQRYMKKKRKCEEAKKYYEEILEDFEYEERAYKAFIEKDNPPVQPVIIESKKDKDTVDSLMIFLAIGVFLVIAIGYIKG